MRNRKQTSWVTILIIVCLLIAVLFYRYMKSAHYRAHFGNENSPTEIDIRDSSLWTHIYHDKRLEVLQPRLTVTGVIERVRKEKDGDDHILLRLDEGQDKLLNEKNIREQHGDLVLEPICVNEVRQQDAIEPCSGYLNNVTIPAIGDSVTVTGTFVLDMEHGWNEIHPVTALEVRGNTGR